MNERYCENCLNLIPHSEFDENPVCSVCISETYDTNPVAKYNEKMGQIRSSLGVACLGFVILGLALLVTTYSSYAFTIVVLQTKRVAGIATPQDLKNITKICLDVGNLDCSETAYRSLASIDTDPADKLEAQKELSHLLFLEKKDPEALVVFESFYNSGGKDFDVDYDYARILSRNGQNEKSEKYFLKVIQAKPNVLQYTVGKSYVEHLIKADELEKAKKFILAWRNKGQNAQFFLQDELDKVTAKDTDEKTKGLDTKNLDAKNKAS